MPEDKQQKLCDAMGELMAKLKAEWEARPENADKTVTYTECRNPGYRNRDS